MTRRLLAPIAAALDDLADGLERYLESLERAFCPDPAPSRPPSARPPRNLNMETEMSTTSNDNDAPFDFDDDIPVDDSQTAASRETDPYWGLCPKCHMHDGYVNLGCDHFFICREHKLAWCIGANLFSSWQDETQEQQAETRRMLGGYEAVKPYYPPELVAEGKRALEELERELKKPRRVGHPRDIPF